MKKYIGLVVLSISILSCNTEFTPRNFSEVVIETIAKDSTYSVRALDFDDDYVYYGSSDHFGKKALRGENKLDLTKLEFKTGKYHYKYEFKNAEGGFLHFRALSVIDGDLLAISIANPARLYKLDRKANQSRLVYEEVHDNVFYDSMGFWNEKEGLAIGDPTDGCMSIIITRDGGETWAKLSCDKLPKANDGEAAFAASDTNISIVGDKVWVATGGKSSRILYSSDKGKTWQVFETPIIQGKETTGMYSLDFCDEYVGFAIGGDYTKSGDSLANKIKTIDGGKTWQVIANGKGPGYRSCVQFIPGSEGKELVAVGFKGVDFSNDGGESWQHLTDEGFYTIRFINDNEAYAAGRGRICKLIFKE